MPNDTSVAGVVDPGAAGTGHVSDQPGSATPATVLHSAITFVLEQGESLLSNIDDEKYTRRLPSAFNSAVGGHYRHCLDHFQSLLQGLDADQVDYDYRARDQRIEADCRFALAETQRIRRACESIPAAFLDCSINVRSQINYENAEGALIRSTVGRELMYAVAHTIHHYALIAVMSALLDVPLPEGFGVAPSTLKHREQQKAA